MTEQISIVNPKENTKTFENPDYYLIFHFENQDYNLVFGENYIVVTLNDTELTEEDILNNTDVYLITEETRVEFYELIENTIKNAD